MRSLRPFAPACLLALAALALTACSDGEGWVRGALTVDVEGCKIDAPTWSLDPDFFAASPVNRGETMELRIQHGTDREDRADNLTIVVPNALDVQSMLGTPIAVSDLVDADVTMTLGLYDTCSPDIRHDDPAVLMAQSGTITFTSLYVPDSGGGKYTEATFDNVVFTDNRTTVRSSATLSGWFRFKYRRNSPSQPFP